MAQSLADLICHVTGLGSYRCPVKQNHVREQMGEVAAPGVSASPEKLWPAVPSSADSTCQGPVPLPQLWFLAQHRLPAVKSPLRWAPYSFCITALL